MNKLVNKILHIPIIINFIAFIDKLAFGKDKILLVEVYSICINEIKKDDLAGKASGVAFNFLMAIFPSVIFLFTLIPYIPVPGLEIQIMDYLKQIMPASIYIVAAETIQDIIAKPRGGLLSFGFIFTWFAALNGTLAIIESFNKMYKTHEKRGFIRKRMVAGVLIFLLAIVLLSSIILLIVGQVVIDYLHHHTTIFSDGNTLLMVNILRYGTVMLSFFFSISIIYYIAPSIQKKWHFFSVGSFFATGLIIFSTYLFSIYITNFSTYNKLYGSIGTLIGLMLWLYIISIVLLVGFEINAAIDQARAKTINRKQKIAQN
jgi:membrane protein